MTTILNGKLISQQIQDELFIEVNKIKAAGGKVPHLAAILVGDDGASETYIAAKIKACEKAGFKSTLIRLPITVNEKELLIKIEDLNNDEDVD